MKGRCSITFPFVRRCKKMFGVICRKSEPTYIAPQNVNARFGNGDIIPLCHMNMPMPHLIAQQVRRRIHFRHQRPVGVTEKMIFEVDAQLAFYLARGVFEGIDGLYRAVGQAVHKLRG